MDEETFLAAMRAEPAKLSLRLLFADWQEENCRPDRATFLRLQCEQAGLLNRNERFQRIADEKQRLIPQVSWAWAKQVGQPRFPLLGQILTSPLNEYGWSHETWSMVVGETDEFVDVVSIEHDSSGRRPSLTPIDGRESRLRKHYFMEGYVEVGERWWIWNWEAGPLQGFTVWLTKRIRRRGETRQPRRDKALFSVG